MKEEKKKNIIMILLVIIILGLGGLLAYILLGNKEKDKPVNIDTEVKETLYSGLKVDDSSNYTNELIVYYDLDGKDFCWSDDKEDCGKTSISIKTENEAKKLDVYLHKYVFYKDNGKLKVYNHETQKSYIINVASNYFSNYFEVDPTTKDFVGIIIRKEDEGKASYYSVVDDKMMYDQKYDDLMFLSKDYLSGDTSKCVKDEDGDDDCNQTYIYLLSTNGEKVVAQYQVTPDEDGYYGGERQYGLLQNEKGLYIYVGEFTDAVAYDEVYTKDLKKIVTKTGEADCDIGTDGNLYVNKKGIVTVYDQEGKKIKESKKYDVLQIISEYIVAIKNNKLIIATVDGEEKELASWNKKKNEYHWMLSGWYEEDGKNGIYLVVQDKNTKIDDVWNYCKKHNNCNGEISSKSELKEYYLGYEYYFVPETKETGKIPTYIGGYAKPILYLYPTKEMNVTVTFDKPENLTTTYPKYNNGWSVLAKPNGDLYDSNGKYYYALYWEENLNHRVDFREGFYVTKENALEFLEEKLNYIGLKDKERNEFIMYWLPILEKNKKSLVYFELTNERNSNSKINISPKPDSMLRLAIHIKKVNGQVKIKEQKLTRFKRTGFSAIEWGGVLY